MNRGATNEEESPLLATSKPTTINTRSPSSLNPTGGRGKVRFGMRKLMRKEDGRITGTSSRSNYSNRHMEGGIYNSLFPSQISHQPIENESPIPTRGGYQQVTTRSTTFNNNNKHSQLYNALNPKSRTTSAHIYQKVMIVIILFDAVIYILSTEPTLSHLANIFYITEAVTSTIFAIEYIARLTVCIEKKSYAKYGPIKGRWKYMLSSQAFIDAFATFPFFIELVSGIPLPTLTYLRVFRILRITRTQSYSQAMNAVGRVLYFNREILHVAALLGMYLVIVTSILMYYLRPRGKDIDLIDDPTDFQSIAKTMVMSTLMLTGQGGPSGNLPWYTQIVVLLTGVFSVAMFAIPASMLTWGFEAEAERLAVRAKKRAIARRRGEVYISDTSSSSSNSSSISGFGDISTSDEEYMNIIGGGDDGDETDKVLLHNSSGVTDKSSIVQTNESQSLVTRIETLEQNMAQISVKLDLILEKIQGR